MTDPAPKKPTITKQFHCPVCKKLHEIEFDSNFANNRSRYPFTHVYLHKFQDSSDIDHLEKDVLTTLYLDAQLNIRGVETLITEEHTNIVSKDDSREMITKLTKVIMDMQQEHEELMERYSELEKKYKQLQP